MDIGNTMDFLTCTEFFFGDLTCALFFFFLKKHAAVKSSVVSRTLGEKTWMSRSTRLELDIFILISCIVHDDVSKPAVTSVVISEIRS